MSKAIKAKEERKETYNCRAPELSGNLLVPRPPPCSCQLGSVSLEDSSWKQRSLSSESEIMRPLVCDCSLHIRQRPRKLWLSKHLPLLGSGSCSQHSWCPPLQGLDALAALALCERELGKLAAPAARERELRAGSLLGRGKVSSFHMQVT